MEALQNLLSTYRSHWWGYAVHPDTTIISTSFWSTLLVFGFASALLTFLFLTTKVIVDIWRGEPTDVVLSFSASTARTIFFLYRYEIYGTSIPAVKKETSNVVGSFGFFRWVTSWLPNGQIRGQLVAKIPEFVLAQTEQPSISSNQKSTSIRKKQSFSKSASSKIEHLSSSSSSSSVCQDKVRKRHSISHVTAEESKTKIPDAHAIKEEEAADCSDGFEDSRRPTRERNKSVIADTSTPSPVYGPSTEIVPIPSPVEQRPSEPSCDESVPLENAGLEKYKRRMTVSEQPVSHPTNIESKFARYFNSSPNSSNPEELEKRLADADLTPPPGFSGRRTKSVMFKPSAAPSHTPLKTVPVVTAQPLNTYRRPTGTFATKGYVATNAQVFSARTSPVPDNLPPVEERANNFFEQRRKILENRNQTPPLSTAPRADQPKPKKPVETFNPISEEPFLFHPQVEKSMSISASWADDDSYALRNILGTGSSYGRASLGVIGSRPSSSTGVKDEAEELEENFSLFNVDLFRSTMQQFNSNNNRP